jgi:hypothetical protein
MDYPKLTFAPAGNTAKGWSSNELIDLNDIFDGTALLCNEKIVRLHLFYFGCVIYT